MNYFCFFLLRNQCKKCYACVEKCLIYQYQSILKIQPRKLCCNIPICRCKIAPLGGSRGRVGVLVISVIFRPNNTKILKIGFFFFFFLWHSILWHYRDTGLRFLSSRWAAGQHRDEALWRKFISFWSEVFLNLWCSVLGYGY